MLAKKCLAGKNRKNYYEIMALDEDKLQQLRFLQEFNDEEVRSLKQLREKYGREEFFRHLDEVFQDPDEVHDLTCGREILDISLDKPYHQYTFCRHELSGDSLVRFKTLVELNDETYIRLLSYCIEDKDMTINKLRYADKAIYNTIVREVDSYLSDDGFYIGDKPYLITMDEIKSDAEMIIQENPDLQTTGIRGYLFM